MTPEVQLALWRRKPDPFHIDQAYLRRVREKQLTHRDRPRMVRRLRSLIQRSSVSLPPDIGDAVLVRVVRIEPMGRVQVELPGGWPGHLSLCDWPGLRRGRDIWAVVQGVDAHWQYQLSARFIDLVPALYRRLCAVDVPMVVDHLNGNIIVWVAHDNKHVVIGVKGTNVRRIGRTLGGLRISVEVQEG